MTTQTQNKQPAAGEAAQLKNLTFTQARARDFDREQEEKHERDGQLDPAIFRKSGEAAHTPTPYVVSKQYRSNDQLPHYWDVCTVREDGADTVYETVAENLSEQDAAFIVRACNSHAALVEALKAILNDHAKCVACEQPGFLTDLQVEQASAALAQAQESQP